MLTKRSNLLNYFFVAVLLLFLGGCATPIEQVMEETEQMMDHALEIGAESAASTEFTKAQDNYVQAMDAFQRDDVNEARRLAKKAQLYAEDAINKVGRQRKALEAEKEQL